MNLLRTIACIAAQSFLCKLALAAALVAVVMSKLLAVASSIGQ